MGTTKRRVLGTCCVCEKPCYADERLTAAAPDCLLRHTECAPPPKDRRVSEVK